jgi:hypothetical protein
MALDYALGVSSKPPPSPPRVDSWARGGRRSKRRAGSADAVCGGQSEEEHLALCLLMLSRGVRGDINPEDAVASARSAGPAAAKASQGYQCSVCGKVYASYQALGGHKTSHRKPPTPPQPQPPVSVASGDEVSGGSAHASEEKVHRCNLCLRTFPSGQALGGHKRLHYEGGGATDGVKDKEQQPVKAKPNPAVVLRDFDLNLPAAAAIGEDATSKIAPPEAKRARMLLVA